MSRGLTLVACVAAALAVACADARAEGAPKTPIRHFITLMQENHTFDNYFGTYPGVDGSRRTRACRSIRREGGSPV